MKFRTIQVISLATSLMFWAGVTPKSFAGQRASKLKSSFRKLKSKIIKQGTSSNKSTDEAFTFAEAIPGLPEDMAFEIATHLPFRDLIGLRTINKNWNPIVDAVLRSDRQLDLREMKIPQNLDPRTGKPTSGLYREKDLENEFKNLFKKNGPLNLAKNVLFSSRNYKGDWMRHLPLKTLTRIQVETPSGGVFTYRGKDPQLGHIWQSPPTLNSPAGLIWGDTAFDKNLFIRKHWSSVKYQAAVRFCNDRNSRLPTKQEFEDYGRFADLSKMGEKKDIEVLRAAYAGYWSSTPHSYGYSVYSYGGGYDGPCTFDETPLDHHRLVRCVREVVGETSREVEGDDVSSILYGENSTSSNSSSENSGSSNLSSVSMDASLEEYMAEF